MGHNNIVPPMMLPQGWICSKCGISYAPHILSCPSYECAPDKAKRRALDLNIECTPKESTL